MTKVRWKSLVVGAATFLAAHAVERAAWLSWFGESEPAHSAWFLNSGRAAAFTAGCVLVAGLLASAAAARDRHDALVHGGNVAAGAVVAMALVLFWIGPGTIFPIVLAFGTVVVAASSLVGTLLTFPFKR